MPWLVLFVIYACWGSLSVISLASVFGLYAEMGNDEAFLCFASMKKISCYPL